MDLNRRSFLGALAALPVAAFTVLTGRHVGMSRLPTYSDYVHANTGPIDECVSWYGLQGADWINDGTYIHGYHGLSRQ